VEHRCRVRLFIDQPVVLQRLAPGAVPGRTLDGVAVIAMPEDAEPTGSSNVAGPDDADVVVSGFHAPLPLYYRRRMTPRRPAWINLEYLSAEAWVDDFHGLPSPQADGLTQHYFYPGFTARSGGLIRETDLIGRRDAFLADAGAASRFLAGLGVARRGGETLASLLCYPDAPLGALARQLDGSDARLHLVVPHGAVEIPDLDALAAASGGQMHITQVPFLAQYDFDALLWACDVNFVRGEDSWIRAVWSGKPFVWQTYKQADAIHLRKLDAFLSLLASAGGGAESNAADMNEAGRLLADACRWWNAAPATDPGALVKLLSRPALARAGLAGLTSRIAEPDLATRLRAFAAGIGASDLPGAAIGKL
jgi:uncharacterized repeat protein (TIGR03837 family)